MKFTDLESKLIVLAMNDGASEGEADTAACKLIDLLKRRFTDGYAFLNEMNQTSGARTYDSEKEYSRGFQAGYQKAQDERGHYNRSYKSSYKRSSTPRTETFGKAEHESGNVYMTFGKHRGLQLKAIPMEYAEWCLRECSNLSPELASAMRNWLSANGR